MKRYRDLIAELSGRVPERMPWDLAESLANDSDALIVDVREPEEFAAMHIPGSINAPRGILETCAEWEYEETIPELAAARDREVVVVCRSGNRSLFAAHTLRTLGFGRVASLRAGVRGWKDDDQPLVDGEGRAVDPAAADRYFTPKVRPDQMRPKRDNVCRLPPARCRCPSLHTGRVPFPLPPASCLQGCVCA